MTQEQQIVPASQNRHSAHALLHLHEARDWLSGEWEDDNGNV